MNEEITLAAEMLAQSHPMSGDPGFLRAVARALKAVGIPEASEVDYGLSAHNIRVLGYAEGFHAARTAAEAQKTSAGEQATQKAASVSNARRATTDAANVAAQAERARIAAIVALDAAKGRESAALHLALTTNLTVAAMPALLASIPAQASALGEQPRPAGLRAKDAPNGLVAFEPEYFGMQPDAKGVWATVTASLNSKAAEQ